MRKVIIVIVVLALAAGGVYAFQQYRLQQEAALLGSYQTEKAVRGSLTATVGATGVVRANQTAQLVWMTSGIIEQVNAEVGEKVNKEQELAHLEKTSLSQNIILAQADLINAQKALDDLSDTVLAQTDALQRISKANEAVKQAEYDLFYFTVPAAIAEMDPFEAIQTTSKKLEEARQAYEPYKLKPDPNAVADPKNQTENMRRQKALKDALERAQSEYNSAVRQLQLQTNLEAARTNLEKAQDDFERLRRGPAPDDVLAAQARIDAAEATLRMQRISAPFDGTITNVMAKPGDQATVGAPAFRLDDLSHLLVDVQVSEVDINRISLGQTASLVFDAIPGTTYQGKVLEVAPVGSSTQGAVDFIVTVELVDADQAVRPGMTAAVNIVVNQIDDALLAPNRAVRIVDGDRVVYVLRNGAPAPVKITLGASSESVSEVLGGDLRVGDEIVLNPPLNFEAGHPPFLR